MKRGDSFHERPRIALVTNHGYGGVVVPVGGAPDTGGQNMYVNSMVEALVEIGYHVTVFARGGFPFFESERIREGIELFGEHARYVYVPGGGDGFIRKEDIAVALDEEVDWLEEFVAQEAKELGCRPFEVYELWNTHYWDAGVIGMLLEERWKAAEALSILEDIATGFAPPQVIESFKERRHRSGAAAALDYLVGVCCLAAVDPTGKPEERIASAVSGWCEAKGVTPGESPEQAVERYKKESRSLGPAVAAMVEVDSVGDAVLSLWDPDGGKRSILDMVERHVFNPHSLGVLKEENFKDRPLDVKRPLKFCERRNHEIAVCNAARAFAATSTEIAERLRTRLGVDPKKIFFFPPGVDRAKFRRYTKEELRPVYSYLSDKTGLAISELEKARLVFETSRMDRTKRKDLLLDAFAMAVRELGDDVYLLIGGGPEKELFETLKRKVEQDSRLDGRAFLLGFIPDEYLYPMFSLADLFVTASEMEGFGMSAAQAAAVGTPIVTSHLVPFAVQYVPDSAIVVRAGDVQGFADAILRLLNDPEEMKERGAALEERTKELDWVSLCKAFLSHLNDRGFHVFTPWS